MKRDNKNIFLVPLYIVCFVPLVMWGRILKLNLSQYAWCMEAEYKKTVDVHTAWNIYRDVNRFYMLFGL